MRIGFAVSLPEQIDRFAPVAARIPGARWIVPPGRWPTSWLDSNQWTRRILRERERASVAEPEGCLDLILAGGGISADALLPWIHPSGQLLQFVDPWRGRGAWDGELSRATIAGDPRMEAALAPATRARARASLGLAADSGRRCVVVRFEREAGEALHFAHALSRLRLQWDVVVAPSNVCWLHARPNLPRPLHGPGIMVLRDSLRHAELLALADVVVAEAGAFAADALRLATPLVLLGAGRVRRRSSPEAHADFGRVVSVLDGCELEEAIERAVEENEAIQSTLGLTREREGAAGRCAQLLMRRAVVCSFERVLADLSADAG